jgi:hypothetical protein
LAPLTDPKIKTKRNEEAILIKNENHAIGRMVMNRHKGITRLGVVQAMKKDSDGWANYNIHFFEDQAYEASQAHRSGLLHEVYHKEAYRSDEVTFIDPEWLNDVLKSYGEYQNER